MKKEDINWNKDFLVQGWQCPICHNVMSPYTPYCIICANNKISYTDNTNGSARIKWTHDQASTYPGTVYIKYPY